MLLTRLNPDRYIFVCVACSILPGLWPRFLLLLCICSRLNTDENSEPSYRTILVLFNCGLFFAGQVDDMHTA